jgi:hypothetical protein
MSVGSRFAGAVTSAVADSFAGLWLSRLERIPDKDEVGGSSPPRPTVSDTTSRIQRRRSPGTDGRGAVLKKIALLGGIVGAGLLVAAKKRRDARTEADLWHEATTSADLR